MKDEAEACVILKNSIINSGGLCWKIPDPSNTFSQTSQRPFDHLGVFHGKPWYSETKYLSKLKSFDLQRIEDHQIENLCAIKRMVPDASCWVVLAVRAGWGDSRLYIFDNPFVIEERRKDRKNILKKELEALPYFPVKKSLIDLTNYEGDHGNEI